MLLKSHFASKHAVLKRQSTREKRWILEDDFGPPLVLYFSEADYGLPLAGGSGQDLELWCMPFQ